MRQLFLEDKAWVSVKVKLKSTVGGGKLTMKNMVVGSKVKADTYDDRTTSYNT